MPLKVPFRRQKYVYTCGPASLKMVLDYFGTRVQRTSIYRRMGSTEETGTSHEALMRAARAYGLRCMERKNATLRDVRTHLAAKRPVIVNYVEPSNEEGHFAVVVCLHKDAIVLNDPWNGRRFHVARRDFVRRWRNNSGSSTRWMVAMEPNTRRSS